MELGTPLLTLQHADGTAAVLREDDGTLWLAGYAEHGGGTMLDDHHGSIEGLRDDRLVQGGLLPDGAVAAELLDHAGQRLAAAAGDGVWLAVIEHHDDQPAAVLFRDVADQIVRPPLPSAWPRESVTDARRPCAVCEAHDWEEVTPLDDSRGLHGTGEGDMQPVKFVSCRVCGHEIRSGGWVSVSLPDIDEDEDDPEAERRAEEERLGRQQDVLVRAEGPVFVLRQWQGERSLSSWGGPTGRITELSVIHGEHTEDHWAEVSVEQRGWGAPEKDVLRRLSGHLRDSDDWVPGRSYAALSIDLDWRDRQATALAHRATTERVTVAIDGEPHDATLARADEHLVCAMDTPHGRLTIAGRGITPDDLELQRLANPVEEL